MFGQVFLGWTSTKQRIKCLVQGHNAVPPVRLKPTTPQSRVNDAFVGINAVYGNDVVIFKGLRAFTISFTKIQCEKSVYFNILPQL